jgi:hypothetical protein
MTPTSTSGASSAGGVEHQHTSGPWFVTSEDDFPTGQVSTSPLGNGDICVIYNENAKADAVLISAAPDLLAALLDERRVRLLGQESNVHWESMRDERRACYAATDAAIAKATGATP